MVDFAKPYLLADQAEYLLFRGQMSEVSRADLEVHMRLDDMSEESRKADGVTRSTVRSRRLDDCFDHLEYRQGAFGKNYKFEVGGDILKFRRAKNAEHQDADLVYSFLVACSVVAEKKSLAPVFTELCKEALARWLGANVEALNIDPGSLDRQNTGKNKRDMAITVGPMLGATPYKDTIAKISTAGDNGADVIAAVPFRDKASGHIGILCQCAASSDETYWRDKIHQPRKFKGLFRWTVDPVVAIFIPSLYRSANGEWLDDSVVTDAVMFDRLRIMRAITCSRERLSQKLRSDIADAMVTSEKESASKKQKKGKTKKTKKKAKQRGKKA